MAKNRLYWATGQLLQGGLVEGFLIAEKKKEAEKMANKQWGDAPSIAVTRVRLKHKGFLNPLLKATK